MLQEKITEAETLLARPKNDEAIPYNVRVDRAIKIYKGICLSDSATNDEKILALCSLFKHYPEEGIDLITRIRDSLMFYKDALRTSALDLLVKITKCPAISSYERYATIVCLYNNYELSICYSCFADFACDSIALLDHRIDACRYLFASENDDYKQIAQDCLLGIIETLTYPSAYRYKIIAGYISKTGISTYLNAKKLRVVYDEIFVYGLQSVFFFNEENGCEERILSGQHLLQMECVDAEEKEKIITLLLGMANNDELVSNIRADAADVVLRLGSVEMSKQAREIIAKLGYAAVDTSKHTSLISKAKTIYTNAQNVHDEKITASVYKFIEKMVNDAKQRMRPYSDIHAEVVDMAKSRKLIPEKRIAVLRTLNRISIDTASFTQLRVSIAEIFVHVWMRICSYEGDKKTFLEDRLIQELLEMSDDTSSTCSSGHASRLINVLAIYESELSISWAEQIKSNLVGRMNARIRDEPNNDLKSTLILGMMKDSEPSDREVFTNFINTRINDIRNEMKKEFVGGDYVKEDDFDRYFKDATLVLL